MSEKGDVAPNDTLVEQVKDQERQLKEQNQYFDSIMTALNEALLVLTPEGNIHICNGSGLKLLEYSCDEVIGQPISFLLESDEPWEKEISLKEMLDKGSTLKDTHFKTKGGEVIPVSLSGAPIFVDETLKGITFLAHDLRTRQGLEKQLNQAQKLEAIGQLAAGVAHEINTPLQYIGDNTEFVNEGITQLMEIMHKYEALEPQLENASDEVKESLNQIHELKEECDAEYLMDEMPRAISQSKEGISHVVKIVQSLKAFSHPGSKDMQLVDLNKAIDSVVTISRNEWKYVAELETVFDQDLGMVPCLARELNQVILNIIVNAAHAIEDVEKESGAKGKITITTKQDTEHAELRINDTGKGIPEDIQTKIFDPFFTTKGVGKGTGQGLSIAHQIINEQHKGELRVESEPGSTTFIIRLPMVIDQSDEDEFADE